MIKEIWKEISGFDGLYKVSNHGRIKTVSRVVDFGLNTRVVKETVRKLKPKPDGYLSVVIYSNHKQHTLYVHRLVAKEFCDGYNESLQVNHKDGNRKNNYFENLEWCTSSQNHKHAYSVLNRRCYMTGRTGTLSCRSKPIAQYTLDGVLIKNFDSAATAQRELGIGESLIRRCLYGKTKQAKGFIWRYAK